MMTTPNRETGAGRFGRLQFWLPDGRTWFEPLDAVAGVVGRGSRSNIRIEHPSLSEQHARIIIDSGQVLIEDLGSATGTTIAGEPIAPFVRTLIRGANVRLGEVTLRLDEGRRAEDRAPIAEGQGAPEVGTIAPSLDIHPAGATAEAGQALTFVLSLRNRSHVVDEFDISVVGLKQDWLRLPFPVRLLPGEQRQVELHISVPQGVVASAGEHRFTVIAMSVSGGQQVTANGLLIVRPFSSAALLLHPSSARRDFNVRLQNTGNADRQFALEAHDDEDVLRFSFGTPAPSLSPGSISEQRLRVARKKRVWFGPNRFDPFAVSVRQTDGPGLGDVVARGQLRVTPPLQKFVAPFSFMVLAGLIVLAAVIAVVFLRDKDAKDAKAEAERAAASATQQANVDATVAAANARVAEADKRAAGGQPGAFPGGDEDVHLCDPEDGAPTPASRPDAKVVDAYFAQNDPRWAKQEYAKDFDTTFPRDWCGSTIEQCGCAMTSVANMLTIFKLAVLAEGQQLNPATLNAYFNGDARKTASGWVSRGYVYGDVVWTAVNQLSAEIARENPSIPVIEFNRTGTGSEDEIREELKAGRPVIIEVPGHWIAAVGFATGDKIKIQDPYYADRTTLDAYKGKVRSSVLFKESDGDQGAVVFTVPAGDRIKITDEQGHVIGNLGELDPREAVRKAQNQIPGATIHYRDAWRDPTCVNKDAKPETGTIQIIIPGSQAGKYHVQVIDATNKDEETSLAVHTFESNGSHGIAHMDGPAGMTKSIAHDGNDGKAGADISDAAATAPGSPVAGTPSPGGGIRTATPLALTPRSGATPTPGTALPPASATPTVKRRRTRRPIAPRVPASRR